MKQKTDASAVQKTEEKKHDTGFSTRFREYRLRDLRKSDERKTKYLPLTCTLNFSHSDPNILPLRTAGDPRRPGIAAILVALFCMYYSIQHIDAGKKMIKSP